MHANRSKFMKNVFKTLLCLFICFALLIVYVPETAKIEVEAKTAAEQALEDYKNSVKDKKSELSELKKAYEELKNQKNAQLSLKMNLEGQKLCLEEEKYITENLISAYGTMYEVKDTNRKQLEMQREITYENLKSTLRYNYMYGKHTTFELLFSADNIIKFLTNDEYVKRVLNYDQVLIEELENDAKELEDLTGEINSMIAEQEQYKDDLAGMQSEIDATTLKIDELVAQIEADIETNQDLQDEANNNINSMNATIEKLLQQIANESQGSYTGGTMMFPLPVSAYKRVSSKYGYRTHPVTGVKQSFHSGVDFPAAKNTKIFAAADGTVISAKYNGGYGNCVMINHGGGIVTLYAHMVSTPPVKVGQKVKAGDVIGYVGTTGSSTGNHLHFEVRVNGKHTDPLGGGYIKLPK